MHCYVTLGNNYIIINACEYVYPMFNHNAAMKAGQL